MWMSQFRIVRTISGLPTDLVDFNGTHARWQLVPPCHDYNRWLPLELFDVKYAHRFCQWGHGHLQQCRLSWHGVRRAKLSEIPRFSRAPVVQWMCGSIRLPLHTWLIFKAHFGINDMQAPSLPLKESNKVAAVTACGVNKMCFVCKHEALSLEIDIHPDSIVFAISKNRS